MPTPVVYLADDNLLGFAFDGGSSWTQFGTLPPRPPASELSSLRPLACAPEHAEHVYTAANTGAGPGNSLYASADAGATWAKHDLSLIPTATAGGPIRFLECRAIGEVYACTRVPSDSAGPYRILRSLDDGVTWTSIFDTTTDMGFIALGRDTLWFAHRLAPTGPVAYRQVNLDGSGLVTRATQATWSATPPLVHLVAAIDDSFAVFVSWAGPSVYRVDASGALVDIRPSGLVKPWDVAIIDATTYVVAGQSGTSTDPMHVYRTTNSGASWSLVLSLAASDSFLNSFAQPDNARILEFGSDISSVWMLGADNNQQQTLLRSVDSGVTWTTLVNPLAAAVAGSWVTSQNSLRAGRRAIAPVLAAIPAHLATIVG